MEPWKKGFLTEATVVEEATTVRTGIPKQEGNGERNTLTPLSFYPQTPYQGLPMAKANWKP